MDRVPEEFKDFVEEKKLQLFNNVVTSTIVGFAAAVVTALALGDLTSTEMLVEISKPTLNVLGFTVIAFGASAFLTNKR